MASGLSILSSALPVVKDGMYLRIQMTHKNDVDGVEKSVNPPPSDPFNVLRQYAMVKDVWANRVDQIPSVLRCLRYVRTNTTVENLMVTYLWVRVKESSHRFTVLSFYFSLKWLSLGL